MTTLREAAQQALEALETGGWNMTAAALRAALAQPDPQDPELSAALGWPGGISDPVLDRKTLLQQVAALRAALAQQAEPVQEPITRLFGTLPVHDAQQAEPVEPVAWSGYDLDGMVEAFSRVIEAHYQRANPFQHPIDMDAQMALRVLRGFIPAMKAYAAIKAVEEGK